MPRLISVISVMMKKMIPYMQEIHRARRAARPAQDGAGTREKWRNHNERTEEKRPRRDRHSGLCAVFHVFRRGKRHIPALFGHGGRKPLAGGLFRVLHRGHRPCHDGHVCAAARGQQRAGAAARGQAPRRDPYVRHRAVHRPHGGHPPHQRQRLRNGHRPQPERRVAGGVLRGIFCADPCAVPEGVRRGGHRGQGAHAAAAGGTVRHHHQGHRGPAGRDRRPAADQQCDRHRHQGGLPDHGCAGGAALRHHYFAERHRQGL